jgi:hypothetical protein
VEIPIFYPIFPVKKEFPNLWKHQLWILKIMKNARPFGARPGMGEDVKKWTSSHFFAHVIHQYFVKDVK